MDHNASSRRSHYHRGRRGTDRRGTERRTPQQAAEQGTRPSGDQVDVDQIMREIRSRVSQRHGIDLTPQQIQELAARRLEAILDPRNVNPSLFDQLRKGAAIAPDPPTQPAEGEREITEDALYEGSGAVRFFRRLLNPLLKLLFNPAPLIAALQMQSRNNREVAARTAERERRQTEWNALHYQVLQRLVTEVSRNSLEVQALSSRVEALAARVDFNDRRVRTLEAPTPARGQRTHEVIHQPAPAPSAEHVTAESMPSPPATGAAPASQPDAQRRRRRRRRGRRGSAPGVEAGGSTTATLAAPAASRDDAAEDEYEEEPQHGAEAEPGPAPSGPGWSEAATGKPLAEAASEPAAPADPMSAGSTPEAVSQPWPTPGPAPTAVPEAAPAEPVDPAGTGSPESKPQ